MAAAGRFDWATVGAAGSDRLDGLYSDGDLPDPVESIDGTNLVLIGRLDSGTRVGTRSRSASRDRLTPPPRWAKPPARSTAATRRSVPRTLTAGATSSPTSSSRLGRRRRRLAAQYKTALMSLRAVEDKTYLGAGLASPSVPWGEAVPAEEAKGYGYNFVWSRDLYQVFTVFEAVGDVETAIDALEYIYTYQQDDRGFIPQNTYLNGRTRWGGEQMDNISFPQVMA